MISNNESGVNLFISEFKPHSESRHERKHGESATLYTFVFVSPPVVFIPVKVCKVVKVIGHVENLQIPLPVTIEERFALHETDIPPK